MKDGSTKTAAALGTGPSHIIKRPRLTRILDRSDARIVLLVAPAGYGKTTLAREWLAQGGRRSAWYRANAAAVDAARFTADLARTLGDAVGERPSSVTQYLRATDRTGLDTRVVVDLLAGLARDWPDLMWLVVDDYHHLLDSPQAEEILWTLSEQSQLPLLVSTRSAPSWATARGSLYGEISEITQASLALTPSEIRRALAGRTALETEAVIAQTGGWPAVVGLAAHAPGPLNLEQTVSGELYQFFADELYRALPLDLRESLIQLLPAQAIDQPLLRGIFGGRATQVSAAAEQAGFLSRFEQRFELHPLLRRFLVDKASESPAGAHDSLWRRTIRLLIAAERWDEAYTAIETLSQPDLLPELVEAALDDLLTNGQVATLERWLTPAASGSSPVLALAESEVLFRRGDLYEAEVAALKAANDPSLPAAQVSRAWYRAGQAAYLTDETPRASAHFHEARELASDDTDRRNALWGLFMLTLDLAEGEPLPYLKEYRRVAPRSPDTELRVATGLLLRANRVGHLPEVLGRAKNAADLVERGSDPLIRSAFLNACSHVFVLAAHYGAAIATVERQLEEVERYGLAFVAPHARVAQARALVGMRELALARDALVQGEAALSLSEDLHCRVDLVLTRARLHIARGELERARVLSETDLGRLPSTVLYSELLGLRALLCASLDRHREAAQLISAIPKAPHIGSSVSASLARVILSLRTQEAGAAAQLRSTLDVVDEHGVYDVLVTAYRASPDLLAALMGLTDREPQMSELLVSANDVEFAARQSRRSPTRAGTGEALSQRELEVYDLLAGGASNREIAERLVITEGTAKAHVHRILAKLGVSSRTQAAIRWQEIERGSAPRRPRSREAADDPH